MTTAHKRVRTAVRLVVVATLLGGGYAWALTPDPVDAVQGGLTLPAWSANASLLPTVACATEDSANCIWDARVQGNGEGRSFIDIDGTAYYFGA